MWAALSTYACRYRKLFSIRNSRHLNTIISLEKAGVSLKQGTDSVEITFKRRDDSVPSFWSKFHHIWLRDNCQCSECYHPGTRQRLLDTLKIGANLRPRSVRLLENSGPTEGDSLVVEWEDGHCSNYPLAWLKVHSYERHGQAEQQSELSLEVEGVVTTWGREISSVPPVVEYGSFMEDDRALLEWSDKVDQYGFCYIDGIPLEPLFSRRVLERIGVLRNTFYGDFWDIEVTAKPTSDLEHGDTAYTVMGIDSHTDGNYFLDAPGLQMLHVTYFKGAGGESFLVDGFKLAQVIKEDNPDHYHILSTVPLDYHYEDKDNRYFNSYVPFTLNPDTGNVSQVHFNDCDRSPISARTLQALHRVKPNGSITDIYGAIQTFIKTMRERELQYQFNLKPGRALIFDNHRVLHARTAFTDRRRLCGGYVNREDWRSRVMITRNKLQCM